MEARFLESPEHHEKSVLESLPVLPEADQKSQKYLKMIALAKYSADFGLRRVPFIRDAYDYAKGARKVLREQKFGDSQQQETKWCHIETAGAHKKLENIAGGETFDTRAEASKKKQKDKKKFLGLNNMELNIGF